MQLLDDLKGRITVSPQEKLFIMGEFMDYIREQYPYIYEEFVSFMIRNKYRNRAIEEGMFWLVDDFFLGRNCDASVMMDMDFIEGIYPIMIYTPKVSMLKGKPLNIIEVDGEQQYEIPVDYNPNMITISPPSLFYNKFIAQLFAYKIAFDELDNILKNNDIDR